MRKAFLFIGVIVLTTMLSSCSRQPRYPQPPLSGADVSIPVASLQHELPQFYTHPVNGTNVSFFIIRLNDRIQSFLDACVTCYPKKRGYADRNGYVECRACDMSFSLYKLEKGLGGCYPIKIEGRIENGNYRIPISTLEKAADKF